jgi:RNA polymerase sigma-70 factor (ECF subfamily)
MQNANSIVPNRQSSRLPKQKLSFDQREGANPMGPFRHREANQSDQPSVDPDSLLVLWAQQNPQAFAALYDRYFPSIYRYCLSQLRNHERAEDATSQTFMKALSALSTYTETGHFRPWIFAIAHNVILDSIKSSRMHEQIEAVEGYRDPAASPEDEAIAAFDLAWLNDAMLRLPPNDRQVLELRRAGLSGVEIANVIGISHAAAKKRQLRAMDRMRAELGAHPDEFEVRRGA